MDQLLDELGGGDFKFGSGVAMPVDGQLDLSALGADPTGGMGAYGDLLSLPMFKMESLGFGEVDNGPRYLLLAQTSPLTKMSDVSVTYLNKGQVYELTLEALGNCQSYRSGLIRTTIRVSFFIMSEIIMRNQEQDQWEAWCSEHPGERIIEIESGFMVENVSHDLLQPNCATFDWHASKGASVMFKLNCLSSEFSAKRHGGEKGALLRLEIDAYYQHTVNDCFDLFHCANCHIKVFKEKGADRKNKVEMQKFTGLSEEDKAGLRAPFSMSVFQDFCVDATSAQKQLPPGVTTLDTTTFIAGPYSVGSMTSPPSSVSTTGSAAAATTPGSVGGAAGGGDLAVATPAMVTPGAVSNSVDSGTESIADVLSCVLAQAQPSPLATSLSFEPEPLRVDSTVEQTQEWLKGNGFGMHLQTLANFSGECARP
ncbi:upstream-binding protein 1-like [Sycon ciliatum]|uniref:upstream-binding protein 1-like n=1 Tax=Sycon ciliatum TaxID=27933 RepID=UPI0031F6495B